MSFVNGADLSVDCNFPGGNIIVDRIAGDRIEVHQDIRDTTTDWFYWYFRLRGAAGRTVQVRFTGNNVIGVLGPAVSLDQGRTWRWLGSGCVEGQTFTYRVPIGHAEVRFSVGMPYVQANLEAFLQKYDDHPALKQAVLCYSRKGRPVEFLSIGQAGRDARFHVVLTARHHCCEMMANYCLEGMINCVLGEAEVSHWLRQHVAFLIVPFMDKDGVEDGDQGKLRYPFDHGRDYVGESIYPEVNALRQLLPQWCRGRLTIALDLHCPFLRGATDEFIYFVGEPEPEPKLWQELGLFSDLLEAARQGPLPFYGKDNLPFGVSWNNRSERDRQCFTGWARETFDNLLLSNIIEIPYANASGIEVNAATVRAFGVDLANAIARYLQSKSLDMGERS